MKEILVVDDHQAMREGLILSLEKMGYDARGVASGEDAVELCRKTEIDLVLMDYRLPEMTGLDATREIRRAAPETDILIITAYGTIELAVEAIREGAIDLLQKPFTPEELQLKLDLIGRHRSSQRKIEAYEGGLAEAFDSKLVTTDPSMVQILQTIDRVAPSESTIFITGESGTGKELLAREIHRRSARASMPLISVNCGALNEGVLESELFGHEKGSFTGAVRQKRGRLELADGGTLFLDEIGDVTPALQVKLLRVLQEGEFERVGGERTITVDIRWICATHRNIWKMVEEGSFREDLYYRLHVVPIEVPPLRQRPEDLLTLVDHFIGLYARKSRRDPVTVDRETMALLKRYEWPGNIRELENLVEMLTILHPGETITIDTLPPKMHHGTVSPVRTDDESLPLLDEAVENLERGLIHEALNLCDGKKKEAAARLGIKPNTLHYKMKKYGLL